MTQHTAAICNPEIDTGLDAETYQVGIANTIIGMFAYLFIVVPVLALTVTGAMNLSGAYGIAVAIAFVLTGLYVTEKFTCLNL